LLRVRVLLPLPSKPLEKAVFLLYRQVFYEKL